MPGSISGEYIPIAKGVTALGGDLDGVHNFVIIPTEAGAARLTDQSIGGAGFEWSGFLRFQDGAQFSFHVKWDKSKRDGTVVMGDETFDLTKGEIFCVGSGPSVRQIPGSKGGEKGDPENAKRLAEIYGREVRAQK